MSKQPPPQKPDTFHQARSRLIDAYAKFETKLIKTLHRAGKPIKGDTVATKLRTVRDAATENSLAAVAGSLDELVKLIALRADIVHSEMVLQDIDGERFACFRNARESVNDVQKTIRIAYKYLKSSAGEIDKLSSALDELKFIPASSPPLPSPGAAGGP